MEPLGVRGTLLKMNEFGRNGLWGVSAWTAMAIDYSRGVIFTRARVSLALLSLEEKWGTTRSLRWQQ